MAKQISVNDKGSIRPEAYAKVRSIELDYTAKSAAVFIDYYNNASDAPVTSGNPSGSETAQAFQFTRFFVQGEDFDTYFADSVLRVSGGSPTKQAYALVSAQDADFAVGTDV